MNENPEGPADLQPGERQVRPAPAAESPPSYGDGWYLSTYLTPPGIPRLLGVWPRHDNNISLWRKEGSEVALVRNWEFERLSGLKQHGAGFTTVGDAWGFIEPLLLGEGVRRQDLQAVWGTPGLDENAVYPVFADDLPIHSFAHLYSTAMMDAKRFHQERILCLAVDGLPDSFLDRTGHYYAGAYVDRGAVTYFPIESPGRLYDSARERYGMRAGTLMALATASPASCGGDPDELLDGLEFWGVGDGTLISPEVERNGRQLVRRAHALAEAAAANGGAVDWDERFSADENVISMTMKLVQAACMRVMERNIDRAVARFGMICEDTYLALAGGFALNCPGNSHLMDRYGFREFIAPPCVNDSGQSIGLALAMFAADGESLKFNFPGAYLGPEVGELPEADEFAGVVTAVTDWNADTFVADIRRRPVAWVEGRSEVGPRALGHRSILADPTQSATKDAVNGLKRRQWWRPVAPVVLAEEAAQWFDGAVESPYMLRTFTIKEDRRERIPAVSHLDDSARIQTVGPDSTDWLRSALVAFAEASGVPMLCNTSLNDAGEPIVETLTEAITFCMRRGIEVLYADGKRIALNLDARPAPPHPAPRLSHRFAKPSRETHAALSLELNPFDLSPVELHGYLDDAALQRFDPTSRPDAAALRARLADWFEEFPDDRDRISEYLHRMWRTNGAPFDEQAE